MKYYYCFTCKKGKTITDSYHNANYVYCYCGEKREEIKEINGKKTKISWWYEVQE